MKSTSTRKGIHSYFKHVRHRYRCFLFAIIGLCSLITLILFLRESDSSIRMSFAIERSSLKSLKRPILSKSNLLMEQLIEDPSNSNEAFSEEKLKQPSQQSFEIHLSEQHLSTVPNLYINASRKSVWSKSCEALTFIDEAMNVTNYAQPLHNGDNTSISSFKHRLVHFDLKGAPPKLEYLKNLLPILKENGATGILLEYEDMFPFQDMLASLAAPNAYCVADIQNLVQLAESLKMEVIPLVQTFGHMEFVLKQEEFQDLRENNLSASAICPLNPRSFPLVSTIIDQVMDLHPRAKWLHIGCDEVFHLAMCKLCNRYKYNKDTLYLNYVSKIAEYVRTTYNVIPIIWDDMIRRTSSRVLKAMSFGDLVEPMVWVYAENVPSLFFPSMWRRYRMIFKHVWAASAYKGAFGRDITVPNVRRHLQNHVSWMKVKNSPAIKVMNFRGLALTGWQRYEHFGPLCELLPVGLPSLVLNLLTVSHGAYTQDIILHFLKTMNCSNEKKQTGSLIEDPFLKSTMRFCTFPGSHIFNLIQNVRVINKKVIYIVESLCDCKLNKNATLSTTDIESYIYQFMNCQSMINELRKALSSALDVVFDNFTIAEWIQQNLNPLTKVIETLVSASERKSFLMTLCKSNCTRTKVSRIFPKIEYHGSDSKRCSKDIFWDL